MLSECRPCQIMIKMGMSASQNLKMEARSKSSTVEMRSVPLANPRRPPSVFVSSVETISRKITSHKYHTREEFVHDMRLIYQNSLSFNGENSEFTLKAKLLLDVVEDTLSEFAEVCEGLEANIRQAQARALEQMDLDSLGTSFSHDENEPKKKRKKKRQHDNSNDYIDVGSEASPGRDDSHDLMEVI